MRQWMVDPKIMCRQHLLGEHVELHMFVGTINKGISIDGYLRDNLLEIPELYARHDELVVEMTNRGYNHKSELPPTKRSYTFEQFYKVINRKAALDELLRRCPRCVERYLSLKTEEQK